MFTWLRSLVSPACILEVSGKRMRVRDLGSGQEHAFDPILAIDSSKRVVSIGRPISPAAVETFEPFMSRSALTKDQRIAELLLQYAYSKVGSNRWLKPAPRVVMVLPNGKDNSLHSVEDADLVELSSRAGAYRTVIRRGERITDQVAIAIAGEA
jgi:hypothetical protein